MRTHGNLIKWNEDRGFGFIAPANGGPEVFVHISAFPRGSGRPVLNELISYETSTSGDGKIRAVQVMRAGQNNTTKRVQHTRSRNNKSISFIELLILSAIGAITYFSFHKYLAYKSAPADIPASTLLAPAAKPQFTCDGRTTCSQMSSCAEAEYFLANCPNTEMDGNHDGEPCEQQWCN